MISMRLGFSTTIVVALAAIAASCGGGSDSSASVADTVPAPDLAATVVDDEARAAGTESAAVTAAPDLLQFTSPLVGGGELDAATLATKPTAFWFWSPT